MATPILSYCSELWTINKKHKSNMYLGMKPLRGVKRCSKLDNRNVDVRDEFTIVNTNVRLNL